MEPAAFIGWLIHSTNCSKPEDVIKFNKWREDLGLKKRDKFDKKKELEAVRRSIAWMKKPIVFAEQSPSPVSKR